MAAALLFGYFGAGNFGDEWVLASFLRNCHQANLTPDNVLVLSRHPERTAAEHQVQALPRHWRAIFAGLRNCQSLIGCGGSLFQDVTSVRSLLFYNLIVWVAKGMGKKVALLAQGLGPLQRPFSRRLVALTLNRCDLLTFRDPVSAALAQRLGVHKDLCIVTADLTFLWDDLPSPVPFYPVALNLRPTAHSWTPETFRTILQEMVEGGQRLLLLPLQPEVDEKSLQPIAGWFPCDWQPYRHWRDGLEGIARTQLLIAMRLHALIAACLVGVSFLGLCYDPKIESILGQVAPDQLLPLNPPIDQFRQALRQLQAEGERWRERIAHFVTAQRQSAQQNLSLLRSLLQA